MFPTPFTTGVSLCKPLGSHRERTPSVTLPHRTGPGAAARCEGERGEQRAGRRKAGLNQLKRNHFPRVMVRRWEWDSKSCQKSFIWYLSAKCGRCQEQNYHSPQVFINNKKSLQAMRVWGAHCENEMAPQTRIREAPSFHPES